jgi:hypothetical protein
MNGQKNLSFEVPKTGLQGNFTRAYYSASGRHVITGACEESTVKLMCTYTGETLASVDLYPGKRDPSLYIQSLRGSPVHDDSLCVLANYRYGLLASLTTLLLSFNPSPLLCYCLLTPLLYSVTVF